MRVRSMRIAPPSRQRGDIPPELDAIVMRALARDPDERWQTAREMRDALTRLFGAVRPKAVGEWVDWAFQTTPMKPVVSQVIRVLDALEQEPPAEQPVAEDDILVAADVDDDIEEVLDEDIVEDTPPSTLPLFVMSMISLFVAVVLVGLYVVA
jgi:hypothetical protein